MSNKKTNDPMNMLTFNQFERIVESRNRVPDVVFKKNETKKSKDGEELKLEDVQKMFNADPTKTKDYVNWLMLLFTRTDKKIFIEDLEKATTYLSIFDKAKHKFGDVAERNIFNYKELSELFDKVQPYMEDTTKILSKRQLRGDTPVDGEFEEIESEDSNWEVIIPNTFAASCYWGSGTGWCTAIDKNPSYYNNYVKDGPLIIFRHKEDSNERYQMHIPSHQFMNKADRAVSPDDFFKSHPEIREALVKYWSQNKGILTRGNQNPVARLIEKLDTTSGFTWSEVLMMVVESGFDLNFESKDGETVLIKVAQKLNSKLVKFFIDHGASVDKVDSKGITPMSAAIFSDGPNKDAASADSETLKICQILDKHGAVCVGATNTNMDPNNVLITAMNKAKWQTALWISNKDGYDVNYWDSTDKNAIAYIALINKDQISAKSGVSGKLSLSEMKNFISNLLKRGIDIDKGTKANNRTPLHLAADKCAKDSTTHLPIIELLLENGANPCSKDSKGDTIYARLKNAKLEDGKLGELFKKISC